jgi:hypothetical protein
MAIIATLRCRSMRKSIAFYTGILDFERVGGDVALEDPSFSVSALDRISDCVDHSSDSFCICEMMPTSRWSSTSPDRRCGVRSSWSFTTRGSREGLPRRGFRPEPATGSADACACN